MSEELDNPRVLRRLAWSGLAALLAADVGGAVAMAVHPLVVSINVKLFMGCDRIHMDVEKINAVSHVSPEID